MEENNTISKSSNLVMPSNNMALAIVGTVLGMCSPCCIGFILGIVAIVMAIQVKKKFESGDYAGAESSAKNAKILSFIAIGIAVLFLTYTGLNWESSMEQYQEVMEQYQEGME